MTTVKDTMSRDFTPVSANTPLMKVAQQMLANGTKVVPVCENGEFLGIITEREIVTGIVAAARDPVTEPASAAVSSLLPSVSPDAGLMDAAWLMVNHSVQVLPVVEDGRLVGLLTLEDLARESLALAALVFSRTLKLQTAGRS